MGNIDKLSTQKKKDVNIKIKSKIYLHITNEKKKWKHYLENYIIPFL